MTWAPVTCWRPTTWKFAGPGNCWEMNRAARSTAWALVWYMEMLQRAVAALKRGEIPDIDAPLDHGSEIKLHMPALIPEDYLPDINGRLILYKRIAAAASETELRDLQVEMIDRFGLLPTQVRNLFLVSQLRLKAQALGIRAIEAGPDGGSIDFNTNTRVPPSAL